MELCNLDLVNFAAIFITIIISFIIGPLLSTYDSI